MPKFQEILAANSKFAATDEQNTGLICVFAGATSGIGAGTVERLASMVKHSTFYILGRSEARFAEQRSKLEALNKSLKIVFFEADVSLISDIDRVCQVISTAEKKVDLLYMSPGSIPLSVAQQTKEGLDISFAISFYCRMRLTTNLLPLLRNSPHPRVLSVLAAGQEKALNTTDLGLQTPENFGHRGAMDQITTLVSLGFEYLAQNDKNITFIHSFPGLVATNIFLRIAAPESFSLLGKAFVSFFGKFVGNIQWMFGWSPFDCGAKQAYILTSSDFGSGEALRVVDNCEKAAANSFLDGLVQEGWAEKVWDHTASAFEKALEFGS